MEATNENKVTLAQNMETINDSIIKVKNLTVQNCTAIENSEDLIDEYLRKQMQLIHSTS